MLHWIELAACVGVYVFLTHLSMISALQNPFIHDIFSFITDDIYVWHAAVWFPVLPLLWRVWKGTTVKWIGQLSRLILLKAILQFLTVTPAPSGMRDCDARAVFWLFSCASTMFSGQVALTMMALQGLPQRRVYVTLQSVLVCVAGIHYVSDCIVAVIAVLYIESIDINVGDFVTNGIPPTGYSCSYLTRSCARAACRVPTKASVYTRVNQHERTSNSKTTSSVENVQDEFGITTP